MSDEATISDLLHENRTFPPPPDVAREANVSGDAFAAADADRLGFWAQAAERLSWETRWERVLDWDPPFAHWFPGGRLNVAYNCVDRHVEVGHGDRVALRWEGEPGDARTLTYLGLRNEVCQAANALLELGVRAGDRVAIYLPMIPEMMVAMLACARIGAPHTVVFGGFSAEALRTRIRDCDAHVVITADGGYRRGAASALKANVDAAVRDCPDVRHVVVVRRTGQEIAWNTELDVWWHDLVDRQSSEHTPDFFESGHPLYILYTSGTTGKPKGILHTTGGYLTYVAWTHWAVFDLKPETDIYWCSADVGWVTGHSYIVYGPLANGATSVMYEGTPDTPHQGRWWELVEKYRVSILYTAPTAIRTAMKWGADIPRRFDLSSLRVLGTVGEPINPEAWMWYREHIGGQRCPIVDTWWQTETGGILITPLPGVHTTKPGSAIRPLPGISAEIYNDDGHLLPRKDAAGYLVLTEPWPGMMRTIWGDDERYRETYWSRFPGVYFAGDGAKWDTDGDIWLLGRVDDVMNVSGHRISTIEVESALVSHPGVAEAAVVGSPDPTTGQAIVAFVIPRGRPETDGQTFARELREHVTREIGPIAKPKQLLVVAELPKTRSGKIMRRLLRDVASNRELGDVTTLTDSSVMDLIKEKLPNAPRED
ncbi:acetate--CoA ligase [Amycolatopsis alkalitolerans]|uniref:Acetyl-coenzyme A synthetase n=1 Tax=Amycolatopsis alkalitolerans TaxID=2547244 RepID=A0A5C4M5L8_9PSEU|nr:acetate--CoA ligase [Amycolatopsis alkalitolerans]TNC28037.1 acetate--CoA ligase [Amycolatopsis alkalitolerans]